MVRTRSSSVSITPTSPTFGVQPKTRNRSLSESRPRKASTSPQRRGQRRNSTSVLLPSSSYSSDSESEQSSPPPPPPPETPSSSSVSSLTSPPEPQLRLLSLPWCCTCLEVGRDQCNLRTAWNAYDRPGEENFSRWLLSKHMSELTPEDLFPIYLLMKLKRTEAGAVLSEMFFGYPPSPKWATVNGHLEPLLAFCRHNGVPWEKPPLEPTLPSTFSLDPVENYRRFVVEHFKLLISYLLRHYFYYYNARPRLGVLELCRLLNSMYADLLALNGLSKKTEDQFYFHAGWLEEFTRQHNCYQRLVVFPPKFEPVKRSSLVETEHTSCTILVHANKLKIIGSDSSTVSSDDIWEYCYISQLFFDPFDGSSDLCDCGQADCTGCFATTCLKCHSRKCGTICRTVQMYLEGDLLTKHGPQC